MELFFLALAILLASGLLALVVGGRERASWIGASGAVLAAIPGVWGAARVLLSGGAWSWAHAWSVPFGSLALGLDPLSALFAGLLFGFAALAAVYGAGYLGGPASHGHRGLGAHWFFYQLLIAGMAIVVAARNAVLFLVAWEIMSLASFFLVTHDDEREEVRAAGWTYLVATHLSLPFLLFLFFLLGRGGSLDFADWALFAAPPTPAMAGLLFALALVGFGTKAGLFPFHVWLPEAHPAAPSHVSALMSGVMIAMGVYGILRTLTFLGPPAAWWGPLLIGVGLVSGFIGIAQAVGQHDMKKMLAYSSMENMGLVALGLGAGLIGLSSNLPTLAALGFAAALLHVLNHAAMKGLLFFGAGAVLRATGTRRIDRLGGLWKRMPGTARLVLLGCIAIAGLPPLNGFAGEFLLFLAAATGGVALKPALAAPLWALAAGLALIGGLAAACFAAFFGAAFLGEPRSAESEQAREVPATLLLPMAILGGGCLALAILAPLVFMGLAPAAAVVTGFDAPAVEAIFLEALTPLLMVAAISAGLLLLVVGLGGWREAVIRRRGRERAPTWDCGYAQPAPRMQYTGSSFLQPLNALLAPLLRPRIALRPPAEIFPSPAAFEAEVPDLAREKIYRPLFGGTAGLLARFRWLQHGNIHLYILYIVVTLVVLLAWRLG